MFFFLFLFPRFNLTSNKPAKDDHKQTTKNQKKKSKTEKIISPCPDKSPLLLGPLRVIDDFAESDPGSKEFRKWFGDHLRIGGIYRPPNCIAKQKVAVIVPYR